MTKYEKTMHFYDRSWYYDAETDLAPDCLFYDYQYFKYYRNAPELEKPWQCNKSFTIKVTTEIIDHEQV